MLHEQREGREGGRRSVEGERGEGGRKRFSRRVSLSISFSLSLSLSLALALSLSLARFSTPHYIIFPFPRPPLPNPQVTYEH